MLQPYHGTIRNIGFLFAHGGQAEDAGNRLYEAAAAVISPDRPEEYFSSPIRYERFTERERHASGLSREALRSAPPLPDVAVFLASFLREADVLLTLNPADQLAALLAGCGNPRVVDLRFAAEFFLPQSDNPGLKGLRERLRGKPREKFSFTAQEAIELSLDLVRHICGRILNTGEFPPAAAVRFYLQRSGTLFGDIFCHLNGRYREYFGGLFDPATGGETPDWKQFLEKAPPQSPLQEGDAPRKKTPSARLDNLYQYLAAAAPGYSVRPSQIAYAGHVASALNDGAILTIEAGTGTGKTQGYLIPVMEFLRQNPAARAAVSTYTKNLQEQIVRREIPLTVSLNRAYRKIPVSILKGKSNYLCAEKLDQLHEDALSGGRLLAWLYFVNRLFHSSEADGEAIGERIRFHLHDGFFFRRLQQESSAKSGCNRRHVRCPAQVAAARAANARLIVTNHHKLALLDRDETLGGLFGNYIIDEANHFEHAVRGAFAVEVSSREMADAVAYLEGVIGRISAGAGSGRAREIAAALRSMEGLREATASLTAALAVIRGDAPPGETALLPAEHPAFTDGKLKRHLRELRGSLKEIAVALAFARDAGSCRELGIRPRTSDRMKTALRDLAEYAETLKEIQDKTISSDFVASFTLYVRHWNLSVRAVEVASLLRDHLYAGRDCVVLTSATLRRGESFDDFRRAAGLMPAPEIAPAPSEASQKEEAETPAETQGREEFRFAAVPSPFPPDAAEVVVHPQALSGAFEGKEVWLARVAEVVPGLIRRNRGRTLVLFASYGDLTAVSERVGEEVRGDGYPLLIQQNGVPTAALCDEFRAIRESVLFGVDTFWYGVDFPGDTLTQVVITRLPFPPPHDPLQIARRNLLPREEYWRRYHYETEIKLRQGIGRLIRSETDRGRVVILDSRCRRLERRGTIA